MATRELSVWGPGKDYVFVGIDLVGPTDQRTCVIGAEAGDIAVGRELGPDGESVGLFFHMDEGDMSLRLSLESAAALGEALIASAKNPGGSDN
jgi:hypothetical protein